LATNKKKTTKSKHHIKLLFWLGFFIVMGFLFLLNWTKISATWDSVFGENIKTEEAKSPEAAPEEANPEAGQQEAKQQEAGPQGAVSIIVKPPAVSAQEAKPGSGQNPEESAKPATGSELNKTSGAETAQTATELNNANTNTGKTPQTEEEQAILEQAILSAGKNQDLGAPKAKPAGAPVGAQAGAPAGAPENKSQKTQKTVERKLYFVRVDDGGMVIVTDVQRAVPLSISPLMDTLQLLLLGPNSKEQRGGLRSFIPAGTKIIGAQVSNGTAFVNFNENFMFNNFGADGYLAQLQEIVWTVTGIPNINNVQILIEGRKVDFLGETIRIDKPLSRDSF